MKPTRCVPYSLACVGTLMLAGAAVGQEGAAQQAERAQETLDEVIVTARLRSERFMDVPVAMNVFTADEIERAGVERPEDFIAMVPNVTLVTAQDSATSFMTIRGLTQVRNSESPVAVVIDGVLTASPAQFRQELFDIEQIEVLKGPQGALYGRNAIGGAITVRTRQPTNQFEGWLRAGIGNGDRNKVQASLSGPIVPDRLLFRVAGSVVEHDGYIRNIFLGQNVDAFQEQAGRLLLKWMPRETVDVDFRASITQNEGGALYYVVNSELFTGGPNWAGDPNDTSVPIESNIRGIDEREVFDTSLKIDVRTPIGTLTSVTAYNDTYARSAADNAPYLRGPEEGTQDGYVDLQAVSQEIRLSSPGDRRLRYILGAYTILTDREALLTTGLDLGPGVLVKGFNPDHPLNPTTTAAWGDEDYEAYALFGQLNFDVTEALELSVALRYDSDEREQTDVRPDAFRIDGLGNPVTGPRTRSETFSKLQPKVSVTYKPSADVTMFASYSEGFRSGGFNAPGAADVASTHEPLVLGVRNIYEQEESRTVEAGLKSRLAGKRLTLNLGAFTTEVENQHYFSFLAAAATQVITNIDRVDLWGGEAELTLHAANGFDLFLGAGYTDSEIKEYIVDPTAVGNWAPYVPDFTFNAGAQYRTQLSSGVEASLRMDYERRGKQYWEPNNIVARDPVDLVRARIGIESVEGGWSLNAWANNLFNERYNEDFVLGGFAFIAQPRTYGLDFTKRF